MAKENTQDSEVEDEYELIPHKEIVELKDEIRKLHENPPSPTKHLQISMNDLARKLDQMTEVFEKSMKVMSDEEGGLSFQERMQPLLHRMDKILEQNAQIADGIVAMADMMNDLKGGAPQKEEELDFPQPLGAPAGMPPFPSAMPPPPGYFPPPGMPPGPRPPLSGLPPPPPPRRR
ncbi:hypothetical protein J4410_02635 [Candidatus Woesearchaeota archaeon]|nr:hypothetical protein [Candidatus Woesearchaeota archaeon]